VRLARVAEASPAQNSARRAVSGEPKAERPFRGCRTLKGHKYQFHPPPPCAPPLLRRTRGTIDGAEDTFTRPVSQYPIALAKPT